MERVDTDLVGTLDTDVREEETKDGGEDGLSDIGLGQGGEEGDRDDWTDEQSASPPQGRDTILHRSLTLVFQVQLALLVPATPTNLPRLSTIATGKGSNFEI